MTDNIEASSLLADYFLYDVFEAHPRAYGKDMSLGVFTEALDAVREAMNSQNDCRFQPLSQASIVQIFETYKKRFESA